jgi:hypothetical protein
MDSLKDPKQKIKSNKVREFRREIKEKYGELYDLCTEILYHHDPANLAACGVPRNEYAGEVCKILPQLKNVGSAAEAQKIIYDAFDSSFNFGYSSKDFSKRVRLSDNAVGTEEKYKAVAEEVWEAWQRFDMLTK